MVGIGSKRRNITPYAATDDFHAAFPETSGEQLQGPEIPVRDLCGGGVAARDPQAFFIEIDRFMPHPGWEKQNVAGMKIELITRRIFHQWIRIPIARFPFLIRTELCKPAHAIAKRCRV
jgi:hypothetical protein